MGKMSSMLLFIVLASLADAKQADDLKTALE
jgi:hypothetical protein